MTALGDVSGLAPGLVADDLPTSTIQCHAANLLPLPDGSLGCVWFGGTQEGVADISVWFSRRTLSRQTTTGWSTPTQLSNDATRSEQNPILFSAPDGVLWLLHTAQLSGHQDTAIVRARQSKDGGQTWGEPQTLFNQTGLFVRQPVVATATHWLVPAFHCRTTPGVRWSGDHDDSTVMASSDQGRTWAEHPVPQSLGCVHMNIVPGRSASHFVAFYRSRWADHVHRSESHNGGLAWTAPVPTELPNNNSSMQAVRLQSGRLAMVFNDISAAQATERRLSLYDEIEADGETEGNRPAIGSAKVQARFAAPAPGARTAFWGTPRAPMTLALSNDDGLTWPHRLALETGDGYCMTNNSAQQRNRELSYPSIVQTADGALHVAYTHHRQRIRHLTLREELLLPA